MGGTSSKTTSISLNTSLRKGFSSSNVKIIERIHTWWLKQDWFQWRKVRGRTIYYLDSGSIRNTQRMNRTALVFRGNFTISKYRSHGTFVEEETIRRKHG
eukprot:TRINITY_DN1489_c0_g1_i8.p2 TRINITY_DN1489_c0_g1~~TRINITY_DN1489_c0_g1_i8.p2  ORF type:complete len:100 (-),score=11.51 TRINITY_DN1489_c0_g1_i8:322-621(-)